MQQTFQEIELKKIKPDPNQPRKYFSEVDMQELTDSIRINKVIQPILVRPNGKGYMIVYGERRYRASLAVQALHKERNTIPCQVREMTDAEALEIQLIENLQRKDVHPLEEAASIAKMLERGDDINEVAERLGKSASYVAKRAKLNDLIPDAQEVFFAGKMTITVAVQMARLDEDVQKEILDSELTSDWRKNLQKQNIIDDIDYQIRQSSQSLKGAKFKTSDAKLYPEAGACTTCPHNSDNQPLLFEDQQVKATCSRISCFEVKTKRALIKKFEKVASDPNVVCIVTDSCLNSIEQRTLEAAEEAGVKILDKKLYERAGSHPGEMQSFEEWFADNDYNYDAIDDDAEVPEYSKAVMIKARRDYEDECLEHEREVKKYEEDKASGKFINAYVVSGSNEGKEVLIRLKSNEAKSVVDAATGNAGDAEILIEISSINQREERNKELDAEKVWTAIRENLLDREELVTEKPLNVTGVEVLVAAVREKLSYRAKRKADEYLETAEGKIGNDVLAYMMRLLIVDALPTTYGSHHIEGSNNQHAYNYIKDILPAEVAEIESKQQEIALARAERVQKRIDSLRKKLSRGNQ